MAGISIPRIARPVLFLAFVFSGICLWINLYVAPRALQDLKDSFFQVVTGNPTAAFTGDQVINDFPGKKIYIGSKNGNELENVHVFSLNPDNKPVQVVFARTGRLETDLAAKQIKMRLEDSRFEQRDFTAADDLTKIKDGIRMGEFVFPISLEELYAKKQGKRRVEAFTYDELKVDVDKKRETMRQDREKLKTDHSDQAKKDFKTDTSQVAAAATELNKRFSFSLACVTFALIGIPLGITAHRQETTVGFGLSLVVALTYFVIIIVVNTIREKANVHPELLIWLPNVIFLLIGGWLFLRLSRR